MNQRVEAREIRVLPAECLESELHQLFASDLGNVVVESLGGEVVDVHVTQDGLHTALW